MMRLMTATRWGAAAALLAVFAAPAPAEVSHTGRNYSVVIGDDGLMKSLTVGSCEMLRPFPGRPSASVVFLDRGNKDPLKFESVGKIEQGTVVARHSQFVLEYVFADDALKIRYESRVLGKVVRVFWRPAAAVTRAIDGEDDTTVDTVKTWYDDMIDGRWVAKTGETLTLNMRGVWSRIPYTVSGTPCYGAYVYPRHKGEWTFRPEPSPGPRTALVFEVKGENDDFLPPGGAPAIFPCEAENLGKDKLQLAYRVTACQYTDRAQALLRRGTFSLDPGAKTRVPVVLDLKKPGVYRAELDLLHADRALKRKVWNFCYNFARWEPRCPRPKDFDRFWRDTLAALDKIPVDLKKQVISGDEKSTLYKLSYAVFNNERAYAWLRVPKGGTKLSGQLTLPSSGVNNLPPPGPSNHVALVIAIHGFDVDTSDFPKKPPYPWPGARYHNVGLESKETYFYRNVYARCCRAVDVLASVPEVDPKRIMVTGGSQGGGLSIVTAGLKPQVALCAPAFPGLTRLDWTVTHAVGSWPLSKADVPKGQTLAQMLATLSYFDAANFAGRIGCPVVGTMGWLDTVTAGGGAVAAFAQANKARLTLYCAPWGRHGGTSRTQQLFWRATREFHAGKPISLPKTWLERRPVK